MKQRWLPGFEGAELEESAAPDGDGAGQPTDVEPSAVPVLPGQFALFTAERELLGLLESALLDGRFEEARDLREALASCEGSSRETVELSVLEQLGRPAFWAQPVDACVDRWLELDGRWEPRPRMRVHVREGVLRRIVLAYGAATAVRAQPLLLPALVNFLGKEAIDDVHAPAEALLRDALAAGVNAPSGEFDDPRFVDLLAEDRSPTWLACIGALNRLWAVPRLPAEELAARGERRHFRPAAT